MNVPMKVQSREASTTPNNYLKLRSNQGNPVIFMLSEDGLILESNTEGKKLFDYSPDEPDKIHISRLVPLLSEIDLLEKGNKRVNPYLRFLSRIGHHFKVAGTSDRKFAGELYFSDIHYHNQHLIMIMIYRASKREKTIRKIETFSKNNSNLMMDSIKKKTIPAHT